MPFNDTYNQVRNAFVLRQAREEENALASQQREAQRKAGALAAGGDTAGATNELFRAGDLKGGQDFQTGQQTYGDAQRKQHVEQVQRIARGLRGAMQAGRPPQEALAMARQFAGTIGVDPAEIDKLAPHFEADPKATLDFIDQQVAKELKIVEGPNGIYGVDPEAGTSRMIQEYPTPPAKPDWYEVKRSDGSTYWRDRNATGQQAAPQGAQSTPPDADQTWRSMIQRESGGRPGVLGPQTRYGQAQGMTQMLPATAQAMAKKLGVPWRPDLMTSKTPEGAAYQEKLGRAYFDEGLQKYGGDTGKAASYYHGGPNEKLWGPKTRAYSAAVAPGRLQGGAGRDTLPPGIMEGDEAPGPDSKAALEEQNLRSQIAEREQKLTDAASKKDKAKESVRDKADLVLSKVDEALGDVNWATSGFVGGNIGRIKGTPAYNLDTTIDTIRANLGFGALQEMRDNSPTGGALGQVTEQELKLLSSTVSSLDTGQSPEQLRRSLQKIKTYYTSILEDLGYSRQPAPAASQPARAPSAPAARAQSGSPPASALKAGHITTFANGQRWTLRDGKPARVQ